jgi:hypothetical protein
MNHFPDRSKMCNRSELKRYSPWWESVSGKVLGCLVNWGREGVVVISKKWVFVKFVSFSVQKNFFSIAQAKIPLSGVVAYKFLSQIFENRWSELTIRQITPRLEQAVTFEPLTTRSLWDGFWWGRCSTCNISPRVNFQEIIPRGAKISRNIGKDTHLTLHKQTQQARIVYLERNPIGLSWDFGLLPSRGQEPPQTPPIRKLFFRQRGVDPKRKTRCRARPRPADKIRRKDGKRAAQNSRNDRTRKVKDQNLSTVQTEIPITWKFAEARARKPIA